MTKTKQKQKQSLKCPTPFKHLILDIGALPFGRIQGKSSLYSKLLNVRKETQEKGTNLESSVQAQAP
jgi:hypothetical protein